MIKIAEGLKKQSILSIIYKLLSIIIGFFSVRILIDYLGNSLYGLWITIISIFSWLSIFNFGIGSGLQNSLSSTYTSTYTSNDKLKSKQLVSTAYISQAVISIFIFILCYFFIRFLPFNKIFDTAGVEKSELLKIFIIMLTSTIIIHVFNNYSSIYNSFGKTSIVLLTGVISQLVMLILFVGLKRNVDDNRILSVSVVYAVVNAGIIMLSSIILFFQKPSLKPSIKHFDKSFIKTLLGISLQFFIIQLCCTIILSTDNIIISKFLGSEEVTRYNLVYKLLLLGKIGFLLLLSPLWPVFSELYLKKERLRIKDLIKKYFIIMLIIDLGIFIISLFIPILIKIWTGRSISIPRTLIIFTTIFIVEDNLVGLFTCFLNAINKIQLQLALFLIGAFINIPLSLLLIKQTSLGSSGIILASIICYLPLAIFIPIQVNSILR